jgi:hypothetical protein
MTKMVSIKLDPSLVQLAPHSGPALVLLRYCSGADTVS